MSKNKRQHIGKRLRFEVFDRDGFTCKYCGRQSDTVVLHIDHLVPVSKGGTNDIDNLVTSCADCNLGKSNRDLGVSSINETDRLRAAQELQEQRESAARLAELVAVRETNRQTLINYWCDQTGRDIYDTATMATVFRYAEQFGMEVVFSWIDSAAAKGLSDTNMGRYISGIRRSVLAELEREQ